MLKVLLLLRSRLRFREASVFAIIGGGLSFVSDVFGVFGRGVGWLLLAAALLLATAIVWSVVLLANRTVTEVRSWSRTKRTNDEDANPPPHPLPFAADASLFLCVTVLFSLMTYLGQVATQGKRSAEDAGTHGLFASLVPAIGELQRSLGGVQHDVGEIKGTLQKVKLETSEDPRKELANLGVSWSDENFMAAVRDGDERALKLFLAGGMNAQTASSEGRPLPVMLALNERNPDSTLDLLVAGGLDPNQAFPLSGGIGPQTTTLIGRAIEKGNVPLVRALVRHHADLNRPIETFGAMGMARQTYPLASAIYWKQYEIASLLLDAGADSSAGDYAAYKDAQAITSQSGAEGPPETLVARLAPTGASADTVNMELRLREVERELTDVALKSLKAMPGTSERDQYDRLYDDLQKERQRIRRALGIAG